MNDWQKRMGVGERQPRGVHNPKATHTARVVADDGPLRGRNVGSTVEHLSGRVDATVSAATVTVNPNLTLRRAEA